jgi:hypothetical protein
MLIIVMPIAPIPMAIPNDSNAAGPPPKIISGSDTVNAEMIVVMKTDAKGFNMMSTAEL